MTNFGFYTQAQKRMDAIASAKAERAEVCRWLKSVYSDLGITEDCDYKFAFGYPVEDLSEYRRDLSHFVGNIEDAAKTYPELSELGIDEYVKSIRARAQDANGGNIGSMTSYISEFLPREMMEYIDTEIPEAYRLGVYRTLMLVGFHLESENMKEIAQQYAEQCKAEHFHKEVL